MGDFRGPGAWRRLQARLDERFLLRNAVALHQACQIPGVECRQRHDEGYLKGDPDADAVHLKPEDVVDALVLEAKAHHLVRKGREDKEPGEVPGELVPPLLAVVERLLEYVLKKVSIEPQ